MLRLQLVVPLVFLFLVGSVCAANEVKIRGFVTSVSSPSSFEIDDYRITRDVSLILDIEKSEAGDGTATFKPEEIRVGTELEIKGDYDSSTGELKARSIKVFLEDTRKLNRTALAEKIPELQKTEMGGWR